MSVGAPALGSPDSRRQGRRESFLGHCLEGAAVDHHAGCTVDRSADAIFPGYSADTGYLGSVHLVDVHHDDTCHGRCSRWAEPGCWHWQLTDSRPFPRPIPGPGQLGLHAPPTTVLKATIGSMR